MTIALNDIVNVAETILLDTGNDRWSAADLCTFGSYAETAIVLRKPDAYVKNLAFILVAGTKQTISDAILIFDIFRNMGTAGTTPGTVITKVEKGVMDAVLPSWHTADASATVKHWMYDPDDPQTFLVYPPQPTSGFGYVDGKWSAFPPAITVGSNITLDDIYREPILDYILFRAYSVDGALAPNAAQRATAHAQLFLNSIGSKESIEEFYTREGVKR